MGGMGAVRPERSEWQKGHILREVRMARERGSGSWEGKGKEVWRRERRRNGEERTVLVSF